MAFSEQEWLDWQRKQRGPVNERFFEIIDRLRQDLADSDLAFDYANDVIIPELEADLEQARADLREKGKDYASDMEACMDERDLAVAKCALASQIITRFAGHLNYCPCREEGDDVCTCGFDELDVRWRQEDNPGQPLLDRLEKLEGLYKAVAESASIASPRIKAALAALEAKKGGL